MIFLNKMTLTLIITLLIFSLDANAQLTEGDPSVGTPGYRLLSSVGKRDAFRRPNFLPTWKLDVKLARLKDVGILGDDVKTGKFDFIRDVFHSFSDLPEEVTRIYMYGNGKSQNNTMLVFGNVSNSWLEDYVVKHLYESKFKDFEYSKKVLRSGLKDITKLTFSSVNEQKERSIYFSRVNSGIHVISSNMIELRRWRDYPRSVLYWRWPNASTLFSFQMIINSTLNNIQKDGVKDVYMLKSKVFKDAKNINLAIKENDTDLYIGSYITTNTPDETYELKKLLTDLITIKQQENMSTVKKSVIENLKIKREDDRLIMESIIAKSILK